MGRRIAGANVLGLVVVLLCVIALQTPPRAGVPTRTAPPAPPPAGVCGDVVRGEFVEASCSQAHTAEITHGWQAGPLADTPPTFGQCADRAREYVGSAPSHVADAHLPGAWTMPLRYRPLVVSGPTPENYPDWSWRACAVAPLGPAPWRGYRGSVRTLPTTGSPSADLRPCYADRAELTTVIACRGPHLGEIVATQALPAGQNQGGQSDRAALRASCHEAARVLTGSDDPTFGGALRVVVLPEPGSDFAGPLSADIGVYYTSDSDSDWAICAVESAVGRRLLDSVAGISSSPLPFE